MGFKQKLATLFIPACLRQDKVMSLHLQTALSLLKQLEADNPDTAQATFAKAMEPVGRAVARQMRDELGTGRTFADVVDVWKIACRVAGMKVERTPDGNGIAFKHIGCPLWAVSKEDQRLCTTLCIPMVRAMTDEIMPGAVTELTQPATPDHACVKTVRPPTEPT